MTDEGIEIDEIATNETINSDSGARRLLFQIDYNTTKEVFERALFLVLVNLGIIMIIIVITVSLFVLKDKRRNLIPNHQKSAILMI